jgi:hypothetical protein
MKQLKKQPRKFTEDLALAKQRDQNKHLKRNYREAIQHIKDVEGELEAVHQSVDNFNTHIIKPNKKGTGGEATAVLVASDWHIEERVTLGQTSGMNSYNLKTAQKRADRFFQNSLVLINICQRDVAIPQIVLALLGDFISGSIHEEGLETNQLQPIDAMITAQGWIASGIEFLLENYKGELIIPCCVGNHSRITARVRHSTERGNSLEMYMYKNLAQRFEKNKRVKFIITNGYHTYIKIYNKVVRLHHGHNVRYLGGIGGMSVPLLRAIAQWNRGKRADIDVLGHHHQFKDFGSAIVNGSIIGYNAYALSIKAEYEPPRQAFFLLDKDRGKTIVAPILVD